MKMAAFGATFSQIIFYFQDGGGGRTRIYEGIASGFTVRYRCQKVPILLGKMKFFSQDAVFHARIMTYMAGAEAEKVLLGSGGIGDVDDRYQIALMAEELDRGTDWHRLEPRLRAMTRILVRRHKPRIERVAKALLTKTTMTAKALDKMVGRSVDDVRMNAPFLKAMHDENTR